jgi:ribosome biogenesis GTPase
MSRLNRNSGDLGVVIKKNMGVYWVNRDALTIPCTLSNRAAKPPGKERDRTKGRPQARPDARKSEGLDPTAAPVTGDLVRFAETGRGSGQILEVLPRRSYLARRSAVPMPGAHAFEQVIAANVDVVVPVFASAQPPPRWNLLDRYLASAESLNLPSLVCITKLDLAQAESDGLLAELELEADVYRRIGYPVLLTSTLDGTGLDELKQALQGRVAVLVGKSGVGKTSLLNALSPGLGLRVNQVNQVTGKGRHTTTQAELFPFEFGGGLIDTPGVREFGLWDVDEDDLALFFPEMRPYLGRCQFGLDCGHEDEPGCAIRKAVMAGRISPRRYQSYLRLKKDGMDDD